MKKVLNTLASNWSWKASKSGKSYKPVPPPGYKKPGGARGGAQSRQRARNRKKA